MYCMRRRAWPGMLALLWIFASLILTIPIPGTEGQVYASTGPDLIIQSIVWSPQAPDIGEQTSFTVNVYNQGDDIAGSSRLVFYIDDKIVDSIFISQIPYGNSLQHIFTWQATAGSHVVKVIADSEEAVAESDETNNEKAYAFSVLAPDLTVGSITWSPEKPSISDPVTFTITMQNQGNKAVNTHWVDFRIDGISRGQREGQPLNPGASYVRTYLWVAQPGQHILTADIDVLNQATESNENNNSFSSVYCTTPPDLAIEALTFTPLTRTESGNVTVSITVKNQGEGDSNGARLDMYINGEIQLPLYLGPVAAGVSVTRTYNWKPGAGEYIFTTTADPENLIFESDESNNSRSITIPALGLPDLTIQSVTWTPSSPTINSRVTFTVTVKNQGTRTVNKCDLALYLPNGTRLTRQPGPIAPGSTVAVNVQWITGTATANARVMVDENNIIAESNETNNEKTYSLTPQEPVPTADLTIESITCTPANPSYGEAVVIKAVVKNQGSSASESSGASLYIDNKMTNYMYFRHLAAGESIEVETKWKATTGQHELRIVVDSGDYIFEINELNNQAATMITTSDPDLAIESIEWFPIYPETGKDVMFTIRVKNQGTKESSQCYMAYYIDGSKQGEHYINPIDAGASLTRSFTWKMQAESQIFRAAIDEINAVVESDESNNDKSALIPAPDLTINSITCSEDYPLADTLLSFTIDIFNNGRSQAGASSVSCYVDGNVMAQVETAPVTAGESVQSVFYWTAEPGKHTLRVSADAGDMITESSEANNTREIIIFVPLPVANEPIIEEETDNITDTAPNTEPEATAPPELTDEEIQALLGYTDDTDNETNPDISGNISATPDENSGGVQSILTNKVLIFGVAGAGIAAIAVLLFLRGRSGKPKKEKAPKAPKPPKAPKAAKPDNKKAAPLKPAAATQAKTAATLSGKPPVMVPVPPKPSTQVQANGISAPIKITPPPIANPAAPPANPNLGASLIQQQVKQPPAPPQPPAL